MGQRITIDSASMFNKAMELIETQEFFGVSPEQIEVLVHPESLIHALVGFRDGALMAHVGPPDMRHAIGYALHWPERRALPVRAAGPGADRHPDVPRPRRGALARAAAGARGDAAPADWRVLRSTPPRKPRSMASSPDASDLPHMAEVVEEVLTRLSCDPGLSSAQMTLDNVSQMDHLARESAAVVIAQQR